MPTKSDNIEQKSSDILPCPHCGGEAELQQPNMFYMAIVCQNCPASLGSDVHSRESVEPLKIEITEAWNTRASVNPWVAVADIPDEWKSEDGPNEGYVDIFNVHGGRFPDATFVEEFETLNGRYTGASRRYWKSASGYEILEPALGMLPPEPPK